MKTERQRAPRKIALVNAPKSPALRTENGF